MFRSLDLNLGNQESQRTFRNRILSLEGSFGVQHEDHILEGSQKEQYRGCWMLWVSLEKIFSPLLPSPFLSSFLFSPLECWEGPQKLHRQEKMQWGYSMVPNAAEEVLWLYKELVASILAEIPCCQDQGPAHKKAVTAWKWLIMGGSDDTRF